MLLFQQNIIADRGILRKEPNPVMQNIDEQVSSSIVQAESRAPLGKMRRILFYVLAALLSAFLLVGFWDIVPGVVLGWLPDSVLSSIHPDFERLFVPHRIHQTAMHAILWGLVLGVGLQLYRPERRVAPLLEALSFMLAFVVIELAVSQPVWGSAVPALFLLLLALLHPRAQDLLRLPRLDWTMAGLIALAAIPWIVFALSQVEFSRLNLPGDAHDQMEHWNRMAVFAILMIVWGLIGATDLPGWRITAWLVTYSSVVYGLQSLLFSSQASAAPAGWAFAAVVWGSAYLIMAERRARSQPERGEAPATYSR